MGNARSAKQVRHHRSGSETSPELSSLFGLTGKEYYFENLVLEGSCAKSLAYVGALTALEKVGILGKLKQFAGVGTSGVIATLLAANFDCDAIESLLNQHIDNLAVDNRCHVVGKDLIEKLGCNSGNKFFDWFGNILETKFDNPDITFQQLYEKTGKALCIVVMNLSRMCEEYFHVKTTPDAVVRHAVLMTISIPGMFQPVKHCIDEQESYYLDGGIVCNYPINCFDGWWLSMERENNFTVWCRSEVDAVSLYKERFAGENLSTLGIILFDKYHYAEEYNIAKEQLGMTVMDAMVPDTNLGREYEDASEKMLFKLEEFKIFHYCYEQFCLMLNSLKDCDDLVEISSLSKLLCRNEYLGAADRAILFDDVIFHEDQCTEFLKKISYGKEMLDIADITDFLDSKSHALYRQCFCSQRTEITNLPCYWRVIADILHKNTKSVLKDNLYRTIGVHTGYIGNNVLQFEEEDECYLFEQGWNSAVSYLRHLNM